MLGHAVPASLSCAGLGARLAAIGGLIYQQCTFSRHDDTLPPRLRVLLGYSDQVNIFAPSVRPAVVPHASTSLAFVLRANPLASQTGCWNGDAHHDPYWIPTGLVMRIANPLGRQEKLVFPLDVDGPHPLSCCFLALHHGRVLVVRAGTASAVPSTARAFSAMLMAAVGEAAAFAAVDMRASSSSSANQVAANSAALSVVSS